MPGPLLGCCPYAGEEMLRGSACVICVQLALPSLAPGKSTLQKAGQERSPQGPFIVQWPRSQHLGNKTLAQPCLEPPAPELPGGAGWDPPRFKDLVHHLASLPGLEVLLHCPPPVGPTHQGLSLPARIGRALWNRVWRGCLPRLKSWGSPPKPQ